MVRSIWFVAIRERLDEIVRREFGVPFEDFVSHVLSLLWPVKRSVASSDKRHLPDIGLGNAFERIDRLWCMDLRISISGSASVFESLSCLSSSTHRVATISPEPSTGS